jgi:steroid delta-isomerase-like uncharacterized protein
MTMRHLLLFAVLFTASFAVAACSSEQQSDSANKMLVRRAHDEVWSQGNLSAIDDLWAVDFVGHAPLGPDWRGPEALRERVQAHRSTFLDWKEEVQDVVAEGDRVAAQWISTGTDTGGFRANPPTGRQVSIREFGFYRIADGKIVEQWVLPDLLLLEQQLGLVTDATVR